VVRLHTREKIGPPEWQLIEEPHLALAGRVKRIEFQADQAVIVRSAFTCGDETYVLRR